MGFKLKYPFINFRSNNGPFIHKTPKYGEAFINVDLCDFTTEYETLLLIKYTKYFTTTSFEGEKGLAFHLELKKISTSASSIGTVHW